MIGTDIVKTVGRLVFELQRGEETTTRNIEIPFPVAPTVVEEAINEINERFTSSDNNLNISVQPASWRDHDRAEEQWTTTRVRYEQIITSTTPVDPDT